MKINTYKKFPELYKKASPGGLIDEAAEGAQALKRLMQGLDEAGSAASPAFKQLLEGIGDSASGITKEVQDIFSYLDELIAETIATKNKIDSGELVKQLREAQNSLSEADRLRRKHWTRYQNAITKNKALREEVTNLVTKYEDALSKALEETAGMQQKVKNLTDEVATITDDAATASQKLAESAIKEAELIEELGSVKNVLKETVQRADKAESALEVLRKENAELTALYEKTLKESDEAAEALKAAQEAGVEGPVVEGLKATAETKSAAASEIGSRLAKGDAVAQEALANSAREARPKTPKAETPPKKTTPETPNKTPKDSSPIGESKSKVPATSVGAASKGWRQGIQEAFRDMATNGVAKVSSAIFSGLGGLVLFAVLSLPILAATGFAGYTLWNWYVSKDVNAARNNARDFDGLIRDAHAKLSKVQFKNGTRTQQIQQSYLGILEGCFGLLPEMIERADDEAFIKDSGIKLQTMLQQTETFLGLKDVYSLDLASQNGWEEAVLAIQALDAAGKKLHSLLNDSVDQARNSQQARQQNPDASQQSEGRQRPAPSPNDKGINVLGKDVYLSQYPELDPATRSAAPYLIKKVLLSPTGLSFWDPEGKWGGGYLSNKGTIADQVIKHIRFFLNPRAIDSNWAYGPINNERKLRKFMRKNMPRTGRKPSSGYKSTRRDYRRNSPRLANSSNINISNVDLFMKNRKNRLKILEKVSSSTNRTDIFTENIEKYADSISKEFYQGALRGLDDQYAKSYYTGLKSMYDQKLGGGKADYKSLYEPHGGTGTEILESSHPKTVVVSDAMGNGGLVENVLEQQRHDIGVALSTPTGNFRGKHANLISALIKIADNADGYDNVDPEISKLVDNAIEDIATILKS